jgi:hypothetical protein
VTVIRPWSRACVLANPRAFLPTVFTLQPATSHCLALNTLVCASATASPGFAIQQQAIGTGAITPFRTPDPCPVPAAPRHSKPPNLCASRAQVPRPSVGIKEQCYALPAQPRLPMDVPLQTIDDRTLQILRGLGAASFQLEASSRLWRCKLYSVEHNAANEVLVKYSWWSRACMLVVTSIHAREVTSMSARD